MKLQLFDMHDAGDDIFSNQLVNADNLNINLELLSPQANGGLQVELSGPKWKVS